MKRRETPWVGLRWLAGGVLAVSALLALRFLLADDGYSALLLQRKELAVLEDEVRSVHLQNVGLEQAVTALAEERHAVERIAREELDMTLPGEWVYLFEMEPVAEPGGE